MIVIPLFGWYVRFSYVVMRSHIYIYLKKKLYKNTFKMETKNKLNARTFECLESMWELWSL